MRYLLRTIPRYACLASLAILAAATGAQAYTYKVIYDFCSERGCTDGANPIEGLTIDAAGNIYGATQTYSPARGTIYELIPVPGKTRWKFRKLAGGKEISNVNGRMIFDVNGNIYGTRGSGGSKGYGAVFELLPDGEHMRRIWKELYSFAQDDPHGAYPNSLTYLGASTGVPYDGVSPLFGTTLDGGNSNQAGVAFALTPNGDSWDETILYTFCSQHDCKDGGRPQGLIVDGSGNLFGNAAQGSGKRGRGVVFELQNNAGSWPEIVLHKFCESPKCSDGAYGWQRLLPDAAGDLLGVTLWGGTGKRCCGVLFQLTPQGVDSPYNVLASFCAKRNCTDGAQPSSDLVMDASGNVFGATQTGGRYRTDGGHLGGGTVFQWAGSTLETLYSFCKLRDCADGEYPIAGLVTDASGNLFGATQYGGKYGAGVVFELTP